MTKAKCPGCQTINTLDGDSCICTGCGKKLTLPAGFKAQKPRPDPVPEPEPEYEPVYEPEPPPAPRRSRRSVDEDDEPVRAPRFVDEEDEDDRPIRRKKRRRQSDVPKDGAKILFLVAGLQFVCGMIVVAAADQIAPGADKSFLMAIVLGLAVVYAALGAWALVQPLPATIIGLIIYAGVFILDVKAAIEMAGAGGGAPGGVFGFFIKIAIIVAMCKAIGTSANAQ